MKLGSLFDGIGGFPLAASRYKIEPVWASEIEPFPIKVTQHHFPNMKHLGDITQINGAEIEPVDIITFGSPCQDLSVAGKREGLSGERSGLFMDAVRIIREMRTATRGKCPRFAVWENVPGAFSSNKGEDFRAVLSEIAETEIPMPRSGKWANAGMVRTERIDIAWRTLDAQYWGVPQRRKRIFLVADFTGRCAGEILFIEKGLSGNLTESGEAREEAAGAVGDSTAKSIDVDLYNWAESAEPQLYDMTHAEEVIRPVEKGLAPTLNARMGTGGNQVPLVMREVSRTLRAEAGAPKHEADWESLILDNNAVATVNCRNLCENEELSGTIHAKENGGYSLNYQNPVRVGYAVRRLTPLECERLMGFPDGWTDIPGASDTAKYRAIGNSVAIPCAESVLGGIAEALSCKKEG